MAETEPKWEGKVTAELKSSTADQVWPLIEDFCGIHKWMPNADTSYQVAGLAGQPGLIRYCAITTPASSDGGDEKKISWAHEKLVAIDPMGRCLSYEILDNNFGFKSYAATIKVFPINGDGEPGCRIEWSFIADPIEGWRLEDLVSYIEQSLQLMAKKMEEALQSAQ